MSSLSICGPCVTHLAKLSIDEFKKLAIFLVRRRPRSHQILTLTTTGLIIMNSIVRPTLLAVALISFAGLLSREAASQPRLPLRMVGVALDFQLSETEAKLAKARELMQVGAHPEALKILKEAVAADPTSATAWNLMGNCHFSLDQFDEALAAYQRARTLEPKNLVILENMAHLGYIVGDTDTTLGLIREALALDPKRDYCHFLLGLIRSDQDKHEEALAAFRAAIAANPNDPSYHYEAGFALVQLERFADAIPLFAMATKLDPAFSLAHNMLGVIAWNLDKPGEAEQHFRAAIKTDPKYALFHANLSGALLAQGKKDEAIAAAKEAQRLGLKEHWTYKELGLS